MWARLCDGIVQKLCQTLLGGAELAERVHGFGSELDGMLTIPDKSCWTCTSKLAAASSGVAAFVCFGRYDPVPVANLSGFEATFARLPETAHAEHDLYRQVGCEFPDARTPTTVARQILKALKAGKIVVE
jgi:hypothetical protein